MPTSFSYVKKGYNPVEVDNYIETLENVVKSYKEKDSAIKNAIINAQIAADNIIKDAEKRSNDMSVQAIKKVELIRNSISAQRSLVKAFQDDYNSLVDKYVSNFNQKDVLPVYASISELEEYLTSLSTDFAEAEADDDDLFAESSEKIFEKEKPRRRKSLDSSKGNFKEEAKKDDSKDADIAELLGRF